MSQSKPVTNNKSKNLLIFLITWLIISGCLTLVIKPKNHQPNEYFQICVVKEQTPTSIAIKDYHNEPFCDVPFENQPMTNPAFNFTLEKIGNDWQLTEYTDSPSDPHHYRYTIKNDNAVPITWQYGGMVTNFSAVVFGLILSAILLKIYKAVFKKRLPV